MASGGAQYYKEINQGMLGLARAGSYASAPQDLSSVPRSLPGSASLVDPDYLERRPVMAPIR